MRVVIVSTLPASGGNSTCCVTLAAHLQNAGYSVRVWALDSRLQPAVANNIKMLERRDIECNVLRMSGWNNSAFFCKKLLPAFGRQRRGEVLISVGLGRTAATLALAGGYECRIGWLINHSPGLPHVTRMGRFMKVFNVVGTISPASIYDCSQCDNIAKKARVLWLPQFSTYPGDPLLSSVHRISRPLFGSTPAVGFLGNLKADKGLRLLLDAWRKTNDLPELVIMGEGVMRDEVESAAATRDYASLVTYLGSFDALGRASALEKFFSRINYLLVPTVIHGEGMPNVIVEALRHGVPVIATNLGGVAAFAEPLLSAPPHVCLLCGPGEIIDTIRRIGSLRGHNNDVASQCRAYYRQWFDDKPVMERWDNAIVFGGNTAAS